MPLPQHTENVKAGFCRDCGLFTAMVGYWGEKMERTLCAGCDLRAWTKLFLETAPVRAKNQLAFNAARKVGMYE